ncbi:MAG: Uma2 family endonuclease [candidate division KSB1 bacterium]|nr:Uma2 family endonuclease [candidate division KSB1 bacterium]MDZ7301805.1 Uma2 family endonuclease [candidate division KSB1 bacterium]MDZ7311416.1 Uma2 family endonuclease [candidate division KSB1 bacterium]
MAESISTAPVETREPVTAVSALRDSENLPLEQRTDVTVDELERLSLPYPAELYNGRVVFKMPNFAHAVIQNNIGKKIGIYLETHPIGLAGGDANFRLWPERTKESRAPDVSFISKERLPKDLYRYLPLAPDLAIEILSPDDSFMRVMEKVDEYLSQGVKLVWVVIASTREVLVCTTQSKYIVRDTLTAPNILPGFELPVQDIFAGLEMSATS